MLEDLLLAFIPFIVFAVGYVLLWRHGKLTKYFCSYEFTDKNGTGAGNCPVPFPLTDQNDVFTFEREIAQRYGYEVVRIISFQPFLRGGR